MVKCKCICDTLTTKSCDAVLWAYRLNKGEVLIIVEKGDRSLSVQLSRKDVKKLSKEIFKDEMPTM
jgi:hypothetical protein